MANLKIRIVTAWICFAPLGLMFFWFLYSKGVALGWLVAAPSVLAEFLTVLAAALNDRAKLPDLDRFPKWRNQPPIPLDKSWV